MSEIELSVVLPAFEEAASLKLLLPKLRDVVHQLTLHSEILVIDAIESRDETPRICADLGIQYVPCRGHDSYGNAVRTGFDVARGRWIVMMDADGSHDPKFLPRLWEQRNQYDLVIASRYVPGGQTENPAILIFMSHIVNVIFRLALNLKCYDVSNSFRLYRGEQVRALPLQCDHFDIVEEILVKLAGTQPGLRIKEVPFTFEKRKAGRTKRRLFLFALGYWGTLWRLRRFRTKDR
jgi:dolichol-phosphate mannosyltransferase